MLKSLFLSLQLLTRKMELVIGDLFICRDFWGLARCLSGWVRRLLCKFEDLSFVLVTDFMSTAAHEAVSIIHIITAKFVGEGIYGTERVGEFAQ